MYGKKPTLEQRLAALPPPTYTPIVHKPILLDFDNCKSSIGDLTGRFLSSQSLTNLQIDFMLAVLQADLMKQAALRESSPTFSVLRTLFSTKVVELYDQQVYDTSDKRQHFVDIVGYDIKAGRTILFGCIFHIDMNHWVSLAVNVAVRTILYADSM